MPGITHDVPVAVAWNSTAFGSSLPSALTGDTGSGWVITGFDQRLIANGDGSLTYVGPDGLTGVFTPNGSGGFTAPTQFAATLTVSGGGWTLRMHASQDLLTFNAAGRLTGDADRDGNTTNINRPLDPQNANRYAYAGDDPINNIDLTGLFNFLQPFQEAVTGAVTGASAER